MHIAVFLPPAVCAGEFGKLLSVFGTARQLNIDDFELSAGDAVRVAERARSTQSIEDSGAYSCERRWHHNNGKKLWE